MLAIRKEQMDALDACARRRFEERMIMRLKTLAGSGLALGDFTSASDEQIRGVIKLGLEQSKAYGVTVERDAARFIELIALTNSELNTRPALNWARALLANRKLPVSARIELVHQQLASRARPASNGASRTG